MGVRMPFRFHHRAIGADAVGHDRCPSGRSDRSDWKLSKPDFGTGIGHLQWMIRKFSVGKAELPRNDLGRC